MLDPCVIDRVVAAFRSGDWDMATNVMERTFPRGVSVEVFPLDLLRRAISDAGDDADREHVTPWFYRNREKLRINSVVHRPDLSAGRLVVDTQEDFEVMERLLEALERPHAEYRVEDVVKLRDGLDTELETSR